MSVQIREVTDPDDPAIAAFGAMQSAAYFAPETLIPAQYIPRLLEAGTGFEGRRNFLIVAERDGGVIGGALFHWLADAGSGFSSFLGVARECRRQGIARRLHEERFRILDRASGGLVPGVFIDVVNPARLSEAELERERRAGSDPWDRRLTFEHLGFRQVDIRYEQPVGGPGGEPVTILDLLYCPRTPAASVPTWLVVDTMRAYWSGWLRESAGRHARELEARAHGATQLALISPVPPPPY
ncbi:MAG TPA: GNAT family N-acetyltransferase [Chloroflexota bacterium]|jgi:GNAT superfamily N-acetyltransferase